MERKIDLGNGYYLENTTGDYYHGFNENDKMVKGIIFKNCKRLYRDDTWEIINIESNNTLDVGPMFENIELFGKLVKRYDEKFSNQ